MKSFDEWFEERMKLAPDDIVKMAFKEVCFDAWNEAQKQQIESDAEICKNLKNNACESGFASQWDCEEAILNNINKTV